MNFSFASPLDGRYLQTKRKDRMASIPNTKVPAKGYLSSGAYLVEAVFRVFVAYMLLRDGTRNYFILAAGLYALGTAAAIVIVHFVKAHK